MADLPECGKDGDCMKRVGRRCYHKAPCRFKRAPAKTQIIGRKVA